MIRFRFILQAAGWMALMICVMAGTEAPGTGESVIPIRQVDKLENLAFDRFTFRLDRAYRQSAPNGVVIEAEQASMIGFSDPGNSPKADPNCSGGYYIDYAKELQFRFEITKAGRYQVWFRAFFPAKGGWSHIEVMDESERACLTDSDHGPAQEWLWTKGRVYEIKEGAHVYHFPTPTAWCGGARLDKVVLLAVGEPEPKGLGPAVSALATPQEGRAISKRLRLDKASAWFLKCDEKQDNGGQVLVEYSHSEDGPWQKYEMGGEPVKAPVGQNQNLWLRITLKGKEGAISPTLRGLAVVLVPLLSPVVTP